MLLIVVCKSPLELSICSSLLASLAIKSNFFKPNHFFVFHKKKKSATRIIMFLPFSLSCCKVSKLGESLLLKRNHAAAYEMKLVFHLCHSQSMNYKLLYCLQRNNYLILKLIRRSLAIHEHRTLSLCHQNSWGSGFCSCKQACYIQLSIFWKLFCSCLSHYSLACSETFLNCHCFCSGLIFPLFLNWSSSSHTHFLLSKLQGQTVLVVVGEVVQVLLVWTLRKPWENCV